MRAHSHRNGRRRKTRFTRGVIDRTLLCLYLRMLEAVAWVVIAVVVTMLDSFATGKESSLLEALFWAVSIYATAVVMGYGIISLGAFIGPVMKPEYRFYGVEAANVAPLVLICLALAVLGPQSGQIQPAMWAAMVVLIFFNFFAAWRVTEQWQKSMPVPADGSPISQP